MGNLNICAIFFIVFSLFMLMQINVSHARKQADEGDELVRENTCLKNPKLAKIHFYTLGVLGGPNATTYEVARAAVSTDAPLSFGKILVFDDFIIAEPRADSEILGRAQGILSSTDMATTALAMDFNFVFTSGKYNGSTLSVAGRNEVAAPQRRLAVAGGTGVFRFSRGHTSATTFSFRQGEGSTISAISEYTIYATFCDCP